MTALDLDLAGGRLLAAIEASRDPRASFCGQVLAGLTAVLELVDQDPDLARLLTADPVSDPELADRLRDCDQTLGALLTAAAAEQGLSLPPDFVGPFLISGIRWVLRSELLRPAPALPSLVDPLLGYILLYYRDPV